MVINKDFSTETLDGEALEVAKIIMSALTSNFPNDWELSGGGCKVFYSPEEWQERGERHGNGSVLVTVYDGGDHAPFFSYDYDSSSSISAMDTALSDAGYMHEPINHWSTAIYKN